jgi:hypothetical protein
MGRIHRREGRKGVDFFCRKQQALCGCFQAISVYFVNQTFFSFIVGFDERINFDVQPFAGKIGMQDYDGYPNLSAILMVIHKFGLFFLLSAFAMKFYVRLSSKEEQQQQHCSPTTLEVGGETGEVELREGEEGSGGEEEQRGISIGDHLSLLLLLQFSMTNLGFYVLAATGANSSSMPDSAAFTILSGVVGILHSFFLLVHHLKSVVRIPNYLYHLLAKGRAGAALTSSVNRRSEV